MQAASDPPAARSPIERLRRWLDVAMVVLIVAIGWAGMAAARTNADVKAAPLGPAVGAMAVVATLPVLWRRRRPLLMLGAALLAVVAAAAVDDRGLFGVQVAAIGVVLLFAVGAWSTRWWTAGAVVVALLAAAVGGAIHDGTNPAASFAYGFALVGLPVAVGYATRTRRQYVAEVEARLAAAERDRDERARLAVAEERQRLARELHDVVAHHVSLIGVQAGAARTVLDRSPEQAAAALSAIEASSRAAVGELRQLLDVLSPMDGVAPPQPGLPDVPALVDRWRVAGVSIDAQLVGDPSGVAPTVSSCCYRLVEEALTNVAKHSTARSATVRVEIGGSVRIEVVDPGPPRPSGADSSAGRGILGMRERVALCGGVLQVGERPDGSFAVTADIAAVPT
jgi:signal transduction histidine kinase